MHVVLVLEVLTKFLSLSRLMAHDHWEEFLPTVLVFIYAMTVPSWWCSFPFITENLILRTLLTGTERLKFSGNVHVLYRMWSHCKHTMYMTVIKLSDEAPTPPPLKMMVTIDYNTNIYSTV